MCNKTRSGKVPDMLQMIYGGRLVTVHLHSKKLMLRIIHFPSRPFDPCERAIVHHCHGDLIDSREDVDEIMDPTKRALKQLQSHVDSSAMKYGLNRLPTELLSQIFLDATSNVKSTVALSHVSRQFRSIVNGSPAIWQRLRLSSSWDRKQILAIAERSAFRSLKANIQPREDVKGKLLDSIPAIFSLHLEDLSIDHAHEFSEPASAIIQRFAYSRFTALPIEMPLLRTLHTRFLPHSSLAGSLVNLSLELRNESLANLLDFLSCTNTLQELSICLLHRTEEVDQEVSDHKAVRPPGLIKLKLKLCFWKWEGSTRFASIVVQKICSSSFQTLALHDMVDPFLSPPWQSTSASDGPFQGILQSNPSCTELELSGFTSIDLCHIPPQVEVLMLTLKFAEYKFPSFECSGTVSSHQIRLIRFHGGHGWGDPWRCFEFQNCRMCYNGSYNLEEVDHAFLYDDGYTDDDSY
ncbi:hypothetical protein ACEPAI_2316 [Sanghuangporus weigelae]